MNTSTPPEGCATSADTDANADADAPDSVPTAGRGAARQREVQIRTTETASEDSNTSLSSPLQRSRSVRSHQERWGGRAADELIPAIVLLNAAFDAMKEVVDVYAVTESEEQAQMSASGGGGRGG
jgi:hypothetical protein